MDSNVNDVYELMAYIVSKNQNGYLSPDQFNLIINQAQRMMVSNLLGSFQTYVPGRPISKVELGQNSVVRTRLQPTIYGYNLNVDTTGFSPYPGDYLQTDTMWTIYGYNRIRYFQQDSWYSAYNSKIDNPIYGNPIYMIEDVGFRFAPESLGQAKLSYVRNPPDIYWASTPDVHGRPIYDPVLSINPIWDSITIVDVIVRALRMTGVNLQANEVSVYAEQIKNQGQ
jgi:hypothetical protein